ncbi:TetR/AcrR family transcriptional regulator C-terminal domain-containing protein [Polaromonas sp.]|uniref:TetR/AcrR family transcriptional regulator C-terminal domain-containing protein n=1 Tax=Polaromonas sp. TaxID=1869339 RepID=UPI003BAACF52
MPKAPDLSLLQDADVRASREPGRRMRSHLLDIAVGLFKARGLGGVSVSEIAAAANAFPSQVTYYFRTKEALFVEAACREILYAGQQAEQAASTALTMERYIRALVESVVASPGLALFIEALTLTRRRQDLAPLVERTFDRLHAEGDRAYGAVRDQRGWSHDDDPAMRARRFWALALGSVLRGAATGLGTQECARDMLELLRSDSPEGARLQVIAGGHPGK